MRIGAHQRGGDVPGLGFLRSPGTKQPRDQRCQVIASMRSICDLPKCAGARHLLLDFSRQPGDGSSRGLGPVMLAVIPTDAVERGFVAAGGMAPCLRTRLPERAAEAKSGRVARGAKMKRPA